MQGLWTNAIDRILDPVQTPLGSMDSLVWHQAEIIILHLSQQKPGKESLEKAFEILERLAQETAYEATEIKTTDSPFTAAKTMDIYLVHAILKSWNQLFRQKIDHTRPSIVCERIDACLKVSKGRLFQPNIATYTIILDGATHCPDPQERVVFTENLLARLISESEENPHLRPTVVTFGTIIHALAKSGSIILAEKAEGWLRRLQQLHEAGWPEVAPNTIVYTQVIQGWANVGEAERAEALLQEMYRESVLHGNKAVLPSLWTFNMVLTAWSKSNDPRCVSFAETFAAQDGGLLQGQGWANTPRPRHDQLQLHDEHDCTTTQTPGLAKKGRILDGRIAELLARGQEEKECCTNPFHVQRSVQYHCIQ